jgi:mRNA-degrading endonuclease RelE of RelBE toxin-antitoxin system
MARMAYDVLLAPEAVQDLRRLSAHDRALARETMERHLRHAPGRVARTSIKRLRGVSRPQYWLRAGDLRIFLDVRGSAVEVLAIVPKPQASDWLAQFGEMEP